MVVQYDIAGKQLWQVFPWQVIDTVTNVNAAITMISNVHKMFIFAKLYWKLQQLKSLEQ